MLSTDKNVNKYTSQPEFTVMKVTIQSHIDNAVCNCTLKHRQQYEQVHIDTKEWQRRPYSKMQGEAGHKSQVTIHTQRRITRHTNTNGYFGTGWGSIFRKSCCVYDILIQYRVQYTVSNSNISDESACFCLYALSQHTSIHWQIIICESSDF